MFRSVCSFKVVDELVEGENRNVFRFKKEDSSSGAKRNINLISVEVLRPQAGSYDKRCQTRVFPPAGRCKTSQGEVCRGMALVITVLDPLQTSHWLAMLNAVYFPAGEEILRAKSSCHKYLKLKQAQGLCLLRAFFSGSHLECHMIGVTICVYEAVAGFFNLSVGVNISNKCDSNGVRVVQFINLVNQQ